VTENLKKTSDSPIPRMGDSKREEKERISIKKYNGIWRKNGTHEISIKTPLTLLKLI
jgi:hypothetical protein